MNKRYNLLHGIIIGLTSFLLLSCTSLPSPEERKHAADILAKSGRLKQQEITTKRFTLLSFARFSHNKTQTIRIYIEGDGFAFYSSNQPSFDPTPLNPTGLKLAIADGSGNIAYLARPCQYLLSSNKATCRNYFWTLGRFSEPVIRSMNQAVDALKKRAGASHVELFGFSGGGNIAALIAARRQDVNLLVTVAGNLDHDYWTQQHNYTPLEGSLNAADIAGKISAIRQYHFIGGNDNNVTPAVVNSYLENVADRSNISVITVDGFDHHCCWAKSWPDLLNSITTE